MINCNNREKIKKIGCYYLGLVIWLLSSAMHIPDGYLSPSSGVVMFLLALPFWWFGIRKIRRTVSARSVPLISLMAAFSFVIMMFNVPLPGGTTAHAAGVAIAAIVLGPEVATIAVTIALVIQALFFGDGGVLTLGANSFNMAIVGSYVSWAVYQTIAKGSEMTSPRRPIGAAIAGWMGLTAAAFFTGVELGLQPLLFKSAAGAPLYAPYPLSVALSAMVIPHMLVASVVEGGITGLIVFYLQRFNLPVLEAAGRAEGMGEGIGFGKLRLLWVGLAVLVAATPLGLLAPGTAWGEWSLEGLTKLGFTSIPAGLARLSELWGAPLADYNVPVLSNANAGYVMSAVVGIFLVAVMVWLFALLVSRRVGGEK